MQFDKLTGTLKLARARWGKQLKQKPEAGQNLACPRNQQKIDLEMSL